jgi:transcription termination/antitermination protein NusG
LSDHHAPVLAETPFLMSEPRPNWYAAYTRPRHEKNVAAQLGMRAVETYLPLYRAIHNWNGRKAEVNLPLFPGYVFIKVPLTDRVRVLEQPGVVRLVGVHGKATPLPDDEIEQLRSALAFCKAEPYPFMVPGEKVRIRTGPMAGFEGKILRRKGKVRLVVSLDLIQRSIVLELDAGSARLAS